MESGTTIVVDRYAYSGAAFAFSKADAVARGLSLDWCRKSDVGLPAPDVIIYLNVPLEVAESRGEYGEERYERRDMQVRVRQRFAALKQADESSALPSSRWCDIDAAYCCTWRR